MSKFWIEQGSVEPVDWAMVNGVQKFLVTDSVAVNLQRLARCLSAKRYPVLLQVQRLVGRQL